MCPTAHRFISTKDLVPILDYKFIVTSREDEKIKLILPMLECGMGFYPRDLELASLCGI